MNSTLRKNVTYSQQKIDSLINENKMLWKEREEPSERAALYMSECNRLERERDAAVKLAAERLEQMNADRKQYLDVRDDAMRYRWLRRAAVHLSLSNDTIASLVKDRAELDGAIQQGEIP